MTIPDRQRRRAVAGVYIGAALIVLDASVLNVALPNIRASIHASFDSLLWILNAYTLALACLLILCGTLADRIGRRNAFIWGVVLFALASSGCAFANETTWLIAARALQGLGAALVATSSLSIVSHIYTEPKERARAFGMWAGVTGIAFAGGPVVGGALIALAGWHSIFFINLPTCALSLLLSAPNIPKMERHPRSWNLKGQFAAMMALAAATYSIIASSETSWQQPNVIAGFLIALISAALFIAHERQAVAQRRETVIPPALLTQGLVRAGLFTAFSCNFCLYGLLLVFTLLFQNTRHYSALATGLAFMPLTVVGAMMSGLVAGKVMAKYGAAAVVIAATSWSALGAIPLMTYQASSPYFYAALGFVVFALGNGLCVPAMTNMVLSHSDKQDHNAASSLINTSRQAGGVLGTSILGAIATSHPNQPQLGLALGIVVVFLAIASVMTWRAAISDDTVLRPSH
ncbi:MFS transporter [Chromobacterium sp. ASV23]|uniref:MFS transporter n=1 Tax=Chromobacterium sp. ASV23 TaxID=2795110 RepID=UPI0018ED4B3C|nr:MFS transporter [Chromobacterium sp. ASV23]